MAKNVPQFVLFLTDQLSSLGDVRYRRFFGGWGFTHSGQQFAMAMKDKMYFRVGDALRLDLAAAGSGPFTYNKAGKQVVVKRYYEAPADCLDDPGMLLQWARRAIAEGRSEA